MLLTGFMAALGGSAYDGMSDEDLLLATARGDREAFRRLYQNTDKSIYGYILSIIKNESDAEEIMQETYMKVWTSAASYEAQGKPLAWMFTIARNLCFMRFRDRKREADISLEELTGDAQGEICVSLENAAEKLALNAALNSLSGEEREIVLLHAGAGMKHREIAGSLDMPLATVLSKYNRAMKKLQKILGKEGES